MWVLLSKVRRDIGRRRLRNALTLTGIVLGVAGIVAISFTGRSIADAQHLTYAGSQRADLAAFASNLSPTTKNLIDRQPNVIVTDTRNVHTTRFSTGDGWHNLRLVGVESLQDMRLDIVELTRGRAPGRGEIVFDESTADLNPVEIGDVVALRDAPGNTITYLTVVGFTQSPASLGAGLLNRATAYTPKASVTGITGRSTDNFILIRVEDQQRASQTGQDISRLLSKRGTPVGTFDVRDPEQFVGSRELDTLLLLLSIFSYLGAALSSVLVANTLSAVMSEEIAQIGIMKSLGASKWHVMATYLAYVGMLGFVGTLAGLLAGVLIGREITAYLTGLTGLQQPATTITMREVGLAMVVGALVTVTASAIPVISTANQRVAPLLRSPGIRGASGGRAMRWLSAPISRINVAAAVGLRNAMRRPARTVSTIVVVTVAVAAFIATQALSRSVSETVDELYDLYGADGWISFQQPVGVGYSSFLERDPWITHVEPWTSARGAFGSTRTDIWGMPERDPLYSYRLIDGTWVTKSNPASAVITSNLAAEIGARVGDLRVLDVGEQRETVTIAGIVDDSSTYLGSAATGKVFMHISDVNRIRRLGQQAEIFAFTLTSNDPADVETALEAIEHRAREFGPTTYSAAADQQASAQAIGVLTLMLNAMVVVVAVVGVTGIANTLLINVSERRREFGILRSLGAATRHVLGVLVIEGSTLAAIGLIAGTIVGYPLARLMVELTSGELFELTFHLSPGALATTFGVAMLTVMAASALPGLVAARIRPIQVLRYE
ncbi:MAG TPA: FtsX-like permease family protein [Thermomicrobiales bacterium]|nr:FtsX-like permease family protein [Thermomicrobiales bacterium]